MVSRDQFVVPSIKKWTAVILQPTAMRGALAGEADRCDA